MNRIIRKATSDDLPRIQELIDAGRKKMRAEGNTEQWTDATPILERIVQDMTNGNSYLLEEEGRVVATFAFVKGPDITYKKIYEGAWLNDKPYYVIHRIASEPGVHGILKDVLAWSESFTDTLRIDTHRKNISMRSALVKYGFRYCGIIYLLDGAERLAFQRQSLFYLNSLPIPWNTLSRTSMISSVTSRTPSVTLSNRVDLPVSPTIFSATCEKK